MNTNKRLTVVTTPKGKLMFSIYGSKQLFSARCAAEAEVELTSYGI